MYVFHIIFVTTSNPHQCDNKSSFFQQVPFYWEYTARLLLNFELFQILLALSLISDNIIMNISSVITLYNWEIIFFFV